MYGPCAGSSCAAAWPAPIAGASRSGCGAAPRTGTGCSSGCTSSGSGPTAPSAPASASGARASCWSARSIGGALQPPRHAPSCGASGARLALGERSADLLRGAGCRFLVGRGHHRGEQRRRRLQQYLQVEPVGPVLDVVVVPLDPITQRGLSAQAADLSEAREPRLDAVTIAVAVDVVLEALRVRQPLGAR